jgi:hypothetical protein
MCARVQSKAKTRGLFSEPSVQWRGLLRLQRTLLRYYQTIGIYSSSLKCCDTVPQLYSVIALISTEGSNVLTAWQLWVMADYFRQCFFINDSLFLFSVVAYLCDKHSTSAQRIRNTVLCPLLVQSMNA